jgi:hypothetical protein
MWKQRWAHVTYLLNYAGDSLLAGHVQFVGNCSDIFRAGSFHSCHEKNCKELHQLSVKASTLEVSSDLDHLLRIIMFGDSVQIDAGIEIDGFELRTVSAGKS